MIVDLFVVISIFIFFIEPEVFLSFSIILVGLYIFRKIIIKKMIKWDMKDKNII